MLHPRFPDFLREAKECDFSINVLSNLTMLDDRILAEMKASRLSGVQVSLYSMRPEIHDGITRLPGSFERTKGAILRLIENDVPLQISCPTMRQNRDCYVDVMRWAREHKCRAMTDYVMMARHDESTDNLENMLSLDDTERLLKSVLANDSEYREEMRDADLAAADARDVSDDAICGVCIDSLCMVASGEVYPCAGWQSYVCGNLRETPLRGI